MSHLSANRATSRMMRSSSAETDRSASARRLSMASRSLTGTEGACSAMLRRNCSSVSSLPSTSAFRLAPSAARMAVKSFRAALSASSTTGQASSGERAASAVEAMISSRSKSDAWRGMGCPARSAARFSSPAREASLFSSSWREPSASASRSTETETPTRPRDTAPWTMERTGASHSA